MRKAPSYYRSDFARDSGIHRTPVVRSLVPSDLITTGIAVVSTCNNIGLIILQNLGGILVEKTSLPVFYGRLTQNDPGRIPA